MKKNVKINKWKLLKYTFFLHPNIIVSDTSIKLPIPSDLKFLCFMVTQESKFNPPDPEMFRVIMDNMPILQTDEKIRNILSNCKIIKSKRQPYNLKRLLTKAKFMSIDTCEVRKCTRPNCGLCIHLVEGNSFKFNCEINFKVHENMTCEVKSVIYVMKCRGCGEEYIGETGNFLRKRVTIHNQQIRDPRTRMLRVSGHIDECASNLNPKYYIFPFYKMYSESTTLRQAKEKFFINSLKPKVKQG